MTYRRFKLPETTSAPATLATFATVHLPEAANVATVATVAGPEPKMRKRDHPQSVASVASVAAPEPDFAHWDEDCWRGFYDERAGIAEFDGGLPRPEAEARAFECCVIEWLNSNFECSPPDRCLACGGGDSAHDALLPHGTESTGNVWLHLRCWPAWHAARKADAAAALKAMGIQDRSKEI